MADRLSTTQIVKVDETLGLVFGYAVVCKEAGADGALADHFDLQGHHIPEDVMLKAASDFAQNSRASKDMHAGDNIQTAVFNFPMTEEIAKSLGITIQKSGWLIAIKPTADILAKYRSGEYTGFSIGGVAHQLEDVA